MTDAELDAEVALALIGGQYDASVGTFYYRGWVIRYRVRGQLYGRIDAELTLCDDGLTRSAQTVCSVMSLVELWSTTIGWGIIQARTLEPIRARQAAQGAKRP